MESELFDRPGEFYQEGVYLGVCHSQTKWWLEKLHHSFQAKQCQHKLDEQSKFPAETFAKFFEVELINEFGKVCWVIIVQHILPRGWEKRFFSNAQAEFHQKEQLYGFWVFRAGIQGEQHGQKFLHFRSFGWGFHQVKHDQQLVGFCPSKLPERQTLLAYWRQTIDGFWQPQGFYACQRRRHFGGFKGQNVLMGWFLHLILLSFHSFMWLIE